MKLRSSPAETAGNGHTTDELVLVDNLCWAWNDPARMERSLHLLAERTALISSAPSSAVFLKDDMAGGMRLRAWVNMDEDARSAASLQMTDIESDPLQTSYSGEMLRVPMLADKQLVGALIVPFPQRPEKQVTARLKVFAERAGSALLRGHQCAEAFERLRIIDDLLDTSKAVIEDVRLPAILQMIAERAARAVHAEHAAVGLIDRRSKELHYIESFGSMSHVITGARMPLTHDMLNLITKGGGAVIVNDAASDSRIPEWAVRDYGIRSIIIVPMRIRRRTIGALIAANRHGGPFAPRDVLVFETIANHAAVAVAHAELHTSARAAHAELDAEKTKIEAVLTQLGDGVVVCDAEGTVVMMNNAAEHIVGLAAKDTIGKKLVSVHPHMFKEEMTSVMAQLAASKPSEGLVWERNIHIHGGKVLRANLRPVFLSNGLFLGSACILRDITEAVALDEAKNEFISTVAHELRTPLTILKGSLGLMLGGAVGKTNDSMNEMMSMAQKNCDRLIRLVDDMLDMAKIEGEHLRIETDIVPVQDRVMSAVRQMRQMAEERDVSIETEIASKLPSIMGDGDRIEQVVTNLISNALKFAPPGSVVKVTARRARGYVRVSVSDHGPGIPRAERRSVFEKFYQVNSQPRQKDSGSGLGLPISKAIVEQHGGKIGLKSTDGTGSTFYFLLPIPGEDALVPEEK